MTFSEVIREKANIKTTQNQKIPLQPSITKEELLKINIYVAHAHYKTQENPGKYSEELNKILEANQLPTIIILENSNPNKEAAEITPQNNITMARESVQATLGKKDTKEQATEAKEKGLTFFTTKERGWPKTNSWHKSNSRELLQQATSVIA